MINRLLPLVCILSIVGCSQGVVLETPEADITYDGLVRDENATLQNVWIKTDIDLASYRGYMLDVDLEFRMPRGGEPRSSASEFPLTEHDQQSLTAFVEDTFREELLKSRYFSEGESPGSAVVRIHVRLMDIVALTPKNPDTGVGTNQDAESMARLYVSSVGEATLVGEVFDTTTGEIIARFVERRAGRQAVGGVQSSRASGWAEIAPGVKRWGGLVRDRMDQIHDL
jgi:hypothetical protein